MRHIDYNGHAPAPAAMTHAQLLAKVTGLCTDLSLLWHHCPDSRRCKGPRGFPDLVIAGPRGIIFAELKTRYDDTTAQQDLWGWTLHRAGQTWCVWYPEHFTNGSIHRALEAITA